MPLMTYEQVAAHYRVTVRTMRNRVWRGEGPTPVLNDSGRVIGWRPEEISRYDKTHQSTRAQYLYRKDK